jgi:hypothetical protein
LGRRRVRNRGVDRKGREIDVRERLIERREGGREGGRDV